MTRPPTLAAHLTSEGERLSSELRGQGLSSVNAAIARAAYAAGFVPVLACTGDRRGVEGFTSPTPQAWFPTWLANHAKAICGACWPEDESEERFILDEKLLACALRVAAAIPEADREVRLSRYVDDVRSCFEVGGKNAVETLLRAGPRRTPVRRAVSK